MAIEWMSTPRSSNISRVGFDRDAGEMIVEFQSGATYAYAGADSATAEALATDPTPGGYFHKNIRDRYPTRKIA
jgi:hypothetical protein